MRLGDILGIGVKRSILRQVSGEIGEDRYTCLQQGLRIVAVVVVVLVVVVVAVAVWLLLLL